MRKINYLCIQCISLKCYSNKIIDLCSSLCDCVLSLYQMKNNLYIFKRNENLICELPELFLTVDRLLKNPTFTIISIGVCFDCFVLPFYSFLPKYVEVKKLFLG